MLWKFVNLTAFMIHARKARNCIPLATAREDKADKLLSSDKSAKQLFVPSMQNKRFFWVCHNMSCIRLIKKSVNQTETLK